MTNYLHRINPMIKLRNYKLGLNFHLLYNKEMNEIFLNVGDSSEEFTSISMKMKLLCFQMIKNKYSVRTVKSSLLELSTLFFLFQGTYPFNWSIVVLQSLIITNIGVLIPRHIKPIYLQLIKMPRAQLPQVNVIMTLLNLIIIINQRVQCRVS